MILLYHKVDVKAQTAFWVSADAFYRQMCDLRSYKVVTLDDYDPTNPDHAVITFDGIYENVIDFAVPILEHFGYPFELFIIGDYLGRDNAFDQAVEPPAQFAGIEQLKSVVKRGGRVQWHSKSHPKLSGLPAEALAQELDVPEVLRDAFGKGHFGWFAFPHGEHDEAVLNAVKSRFEGALSCVAGNELDRYSYNRITVKEKTTWKRSSVSIIIPNYNYGHFLPEAIESVLSQTTPPDEILVIDDASDDESRDVLKAYEGRVRIELNKQNLGIVENFRKAVSLTTGDYIAFLGADNRYRSDFVEKSRAALDRNENAAVAYTDLVMFGQRVQMMADRENVSKVGYSLAERWPILLREYPDPTEEALANFQTHNFVHGSSMYRRRDYEAAGGYRASGQPEDHNLFYRMHKLGRDLVHIDEPLLEYRQHSSKQANTVLGLENQNRMLRQRVKALEDERSRLAKKNQQTEATLKAFREREKRLLSDSSQGDPGPARDLDRKLRSSFDAPRGKQKAPFREVLSSLSRGVRAASSLKDLSLKDLDVAVVHYKQVRPTVAMLISFFRQYPDLTVTLVDNSGGVCSVETQVLPHLKEFEKNIHVIVNPATEHGIMAPLSHGGGIDFAVENSSKKYLVSLETDSFFLKPDGLEFLLNLIKQGYEWAGLGQKPYRGEFASFSPSFAVFNIDIIRRHGFSFRVKNREAGEVFENDLLLKHHLEAAQLLREGSAIDYFSGKPPDTYRRPKANIISAELHHLSYFDTGEWLHYALAQEGYRFKLFEPIESVCHSWGSRDEEIFLENFAYTLPHLELNDFLPEALHVPLYERCEIPGLDLGAIHESVKAGNSELKSWWAVPAGAGAELDLAEEGLAIRFPKRGMAYIGLGSQGFDKPPPEHLQAELAPDWKYQVYCKCDVRSGELAGQLWVIEYNNGRRGKSHTVPLRMPETRFSFTSQKDATHFRVFLRLEGQGEALVSMIELRRRGQ